MACDDMTKQTTGKVQILRNDLEAYVKNDSVRILAYAFSIGDVAFTMHPYEMFDTNGKFVKDNSPFNITFVVTLANNSGGYIAAEWAYEYGGYEVEYVGYNKGTAEDLASIARQTPTGSNGILLPPCPPPAVTIFLHPM